MKKNRPELPPLFRRHVRRPRLTRILDDTSAQAILLTAPAGYGKTTLAAEWLQGRPRVAWYRATPASADIAALALGVADALYGESEFAERLAQRLRMGDAPERAGEIFADFLTKHVPNRRQREWLVVDDYHFIAGSATAENFINRLLTLLPTQVCIATRVRPSWADARRRLYGHLVELRREQLAMTPDEAASVLGLAPARRGSIADLASGWPVVVGLAAIAAASEAPADQVSEALFDFFAEEVLRQESVSVQDFMLETSVLPNLTVGAIQEVLGRPDTGPIVDALNDKGLLHETGEGLHFHVLLRNFLRQRLELVDPQRHEAVTRRTLEFLRKTASWDSAHAIAIDMAWKNDAATIIGDAYPTLLALGRVETLERWLDASAEAVLDVPAAQLARAHVLLRRGRCHEARLLAEEVAEGEATPTAIASDAWFLAGEAAVLVSDHEAALERHLRASACATADAQKRQALWGAFVSAAERGMREAEAYLCELNDFAAHDVDTRLRTAIGRTVIAENRGTFADVWTQERSTLETASRAADPMVATSALGCFSYVNSVRGDYEMALDLASRAATLSRDLSLDFAFGYCLIYRAIAHIGLRELTDARRLDPELDRLATHHEDPHFQIELANLRLRAALSTNTITDLEPDAFSGERVPPKPYGEYLALRALAAACRHLRDVSHQYIAQARSSSRAAEARSLTELASFVVHDPPHRDEAADRLEQLLVRLQRDECLGCFVLAYRACPRLLKLAQERPKSRLIATRAIVRARDVVLANRHGFAIRQPAADAPPQLSPREREVYALIIEGCSNSEIAERLVISVGTAKAHVHNVLRKLGVKSRVHAVVAAPRDSQE